MQPNTQTSNYVLPQGNNDEIVNPGTNNQSGLIENQQTGLIENVTPDQQNENANVIPSQQHQETTIDANVQSTIHQRTVELDPGTHVDDDQLQLESIEMNTEEQQLQQVVKQSETKSNKNYNSNLNEEEKDAGENDGEDSQIREKSPNKFASNTVANTDANKETLGFMIGRLSESDKEKQHGKFCITHIILPLQIGTNDSCSALSGEHGEQAAGIFIRSDPKYFILGWIHTHPKFDHFLSSVDVHTSALYQNTEPKSIAIVQDICRDFKAYRVKPEFVDEAMKCKKTGAHHEGHEDSWETAANFSMPDIDMKNVLWDLRLEPKRTEFDKICKTGLDKQGVDQDLVEKQELDEQLCQSTLTHSKDPYLLLGISESANDSEIEKACRQLQITFDQEYNTYATAKYCLEFIDYAKQLLLNHQMRELYNSEVAKDKKNLFKGKNVREIFIIAKGNVDYANKTKASVQTKEKAKLDSQTKGKADPKVMSIISGNAQNLFSTEQQDEASSAKISDSEAAKLDIEIDKKYGSGVIGRKGGSKFTRRKGKRVAASNQSPIRASQTEQNVSISSNIKRKDTTSPGKGATFSGKDTTSPGKGATFSGKDTTSPGKGATFPGKYTTSPDKKYHRFLRSQAKEHPKTRNNTAGASPIKSQFYHNIPKLKHSYSSATYSPTKPKPNDKSKLKKTTSQKDNKGKDDVKAQTSNSTGLLGKIKHFVGSYLPTDKDKQPESGEAQHEEVEVQEAKKEAQEEGEIEENIEEEDQEELEEEAGGEEDEEEIEEDVEGEDEEGEEELEEVGGKEDEEELEEVRGEEDEEEGEEEIEEQIEENKSEEEPRGAFQRIMNKSIKQTKHHQVQSKMNLINSVSIKRAQQNNPAFQKYKQSLNKKQPQMVKKRDQKQKSKKQTSDRASSSLASSDTEESQEVMNAKMVKILREMGLFGAYGGNKPKGKAEVEQLWQYYNRNYDIVRQKLEPFSGNHEQSWIKPVFPWAKTQSKSVIICDQCYRLCDDKTAAMHFILKHDNHVENIIKDIGGGQIDPRTLLADRLSVLRFFHTECVVVGSGREKIKTNYPDEFHKFVGKHYLNERSINWIVKAEKANGKKYMKNGIALPTILKENSKQYDDLMSRVANFIGGGNKDSEIRDRWIRLFFGYAVQKREANQKLPSQYNIDFIRDHFHGGNFLSVGAKSPNSKILEPQIQGDIVTSLGFARTMGSTMAQVVVAQKIREYYKGIQMPSFLEKHAEPDILRILAKAKRNNIVGHDMDQFVLGFDEKLPQLLKKRSFQGNQSKSAQTETQEWNKKRLGISNLFYSESKSRRKDSISSQRRDSISSQKDSGLAHKDEEPNKIIVSPRDAMAHHKRQKTTSASPNKIISQPPQNKLQGIEPLSSKNITEAVETNLVQKKATVLSKNNNVKAKQTPRKSQRVAASNQSPMEASQTEQNVNMSSKIKRKDTTSPGKDTTSPGKDTTSPNKKRVSRLSCKKRAPAKKVSFPSGGMNIQTRASVKQIVTKSLTKSTPKAVKINPRQDTTHLTDKYKQQKPNLNQISTPRDHRQSAQKNSKAFQSGLKVLKAAKEEKKAMTHCAICGRKFKIGQPVYKCKTCEDCHETDYIAFYCTNCVPQSRRKSKTACLIHADTPLVIHQD